MSVQQIALVLNWGWGRCWSNIHPVLLMFRLHVVAALLITVVQSHFSLPSVLWPQIFTLMSSFCSQQQDLWWLQLRVEAEVESNELYRQPDAFTEPVVVHVGSGLHWRALLHWRRSWLAEKERLSDAVSFYDMLKSWRWYESGFKAIKIPGIFPCQFRVHLLCMYDIHTPWFR